jgi:hypothetical protein
VIVSAWSFSLAHESAAAWCASSTITITKSAISWRSKKVANQDGLDKVCQVVMMLLVSDRLDVETHTLSAESDL